MSLTFSLMNVLSNFTSKAEELSTLFIFSWDEQETKKIKNMKNSDGLIDKFLKK